jgi:hypothetical protein
MKTQEEIKYQNMCADLLTGDFSQYRRFPESVGNVVRWLRAVGLRDYDRVQVGQKNGINQVTLFGEVIATFTFTKEPTEMPVFRFSAKYDWCQDRQDNYITNYGKFEDPYEKYKIAVQSKGGEQ